jgi:hypothetical protein
MNASQFEKLIQAVTGRPLTFKAGAEELPLSGKVAIYRPYKAGQTIFAFEWKTPKNEDALLRSFITAFCSKYLEPDPEMYSRNCSVYGDTWAKYSAAWNDAETRWNCALWNHHRSNQLSKEKLMAQVVCNFSNFDSAMSKLGFYPTNYGVGIFTIYGGKAISDSLAGMARHLENLAIPYKTELSKAAWVTRFILGIDKESHRKICAEF